MECTEQYPVEASELVSVNVPAYGEARISDEHRLRMVCGISSYTAADIAGDPDGDPKTAGEIPPCYLDLFEAGTMVPRIKDLPVSRLCSSQARGTQIINGATPVGMGVQAFQLRYGPGIDLAASKVKNPTATPRNVTLEIFYR